MLLYAILPGGGHWQAILSRVDPGSYSTSSSSIRHQKFRLPRWEVGFKLAKLLLQGQTSLSAEWRKPNFTKIISSTHKCTTKKHILTSSSSAKTSLYNRKHSSATRKALPLSETKLHKKSVLFNERDRWDLNPVLPRLHWLRSSFPEKFIGEVFRVFFLFPPLAF